LGYLEGMTVEAIQEAIVQLSDIERRALAEWLGELEEDAWDRQMEQDFSPGGRGAKLIAEAEADIAAGRTRPVEEGNRDLDLDRRT